MACIQLLSRHSGSRRQTHGAPVWFCLVRNPQTRFLPGSRPQFRTVRRNGRDRREAPQAHERWKKWRECRGARSGLLMPGQAFSGQVFLIARLSGKRGRTVLSTDVTVADARHPIKLCVRTRTQAVRWATVRGGGARRPQRARFRSSVRPLRALYFLLMSQLAWVVVHSHGWWSILMGHHSHGYPIYALEYVCTLHVL